MNFIMLASMDTEIKPYTWQFWLCSDKIEQ